MFRGVDDFCNVFIQGWESRLINNGEIKISQIQAQEQTKQQIPDLDSILSYSLKGLPKLYPAIKRSQQVQTAFQLPIILRVN